MDRPLTPLNGSESGFSATQSRATQSTEERQPQGAWSANQPPSINLPKGGGAIRGIGEKFSANLVTGTGSMTVPIATSRGRSGFGPQLSLAYDSGAGNGRFGFGWTLSTPSIARKTDKGLPQYRDAEDSDVFVLSGAEDLVPVFRQDASGDWVARHSGKGYRRDPDGSWVRDSSGRLVVHEEVRDPSGRLVVNEDRSDGYRVRRYRPRVEGLFARIERWTKIDTPTDVHWRSISSDNILTVYGFDRDSRIVDPLDSSRIFSWLICQTRDDKGNAVLYRYKAEDGIGVELNEAHERNRGPRDDVRRTANRYLKRIYYGNRTSLLDDAGERPPFLDRTQIDAGWMFEVVFDYGDHDVAAPGPSDDTKTDAAKSLMYPWKCRPDPFSSYRSGFEVRTTRLCQRVLMFHHFPGEAEVGRDCLVRSTDFTYSDEVDPTDVRNPVYAFLRSVTQTGYSRNGSGYDSRSLPPVEFEYTEPTVQDTIEDIDPSSLENLPIGLDGSAYRWTDLHGEGIPGILTEQAGAWYYKRNLSPIYPNLNGGREPVRVHFAPLETVALKPNVSLNGGAEIMDLAGDGQPDVVVMQGATPGVYEHDDAEGWQPFRPFTSRLNRYLSDPNLKFIDIDGDARADVLITEDEAFVWHASLGEEGFGPAQRLAQALDEEKGPRIVFADGTQSIYLADLSGDGLTDLARVRNGEVCYWPNLGYGRFGAKVTMDNAPWFDNPDQFDHQRIRLADIDGSGTTDLIYLHSDGVRLYFNQSGNSWSSSHRVNVFPRVDDMVSIIPTDLLGNGTTCLVWSSPLPGDVRQPMRYVNLMGGRKPHLLVKTINNLGAETRVDYATSTKFYLNDRRDGRPWITRLPFPVHVVELVATYDHVSCNRFVTRYAYHHGYFDGEEREFRGFGMVDQWDTEEFAALVSGGLPAGNIATASHVPPIHTKTWFHTGVYLGRERVSRQFEEDYYLEGLHIETAQALLLDDTVVPAGLTLEEEREACRALKGSTLRQEVYADDAKPGANAAQIQRAQTPYTVTEQNFSIRALQPRGTNRAAIFFAHAREAINYHYERNPNDPRVQHSLTLEVDSFGSVLKQATISYGRREQIRVIDAQGQVQQVPNPDLALLERADRSKQTTPLLTYTENRVTNGVESADTHRNPLPCEALTFELTGYTATGPPTGPANGVRRFQAADLVEPDPARPGRLHHKFTRPEVLYEAAATGSGRRRPIEWLRTLYRRDDLTNLLPLGELQPLSLPGESYKLAFTPGLLTQVFQRPPAGQPAEPLLPDPAAVLGGQAANQGGYVQSQTLKADGRFPVSDGNDHWWIPSGRSFFTTKSSDSAVAELAQAREHFFLPRRNRDPFGQDAVVDFDTNDLLMIETRDALDNRVTADANDYRVLEPRLVSDPNRNRTEVAFDALGMVVGTAVMGKPLPAPAEGDTVVGFVVDPTQAQLDGFFDAADPHATAPALLQNATTRIIYDLDRFRLTRQAHPHDPTKWQPVYAVTLARETHVSALLPPQGLKIQISFSYSDGFGREVQKKIQAEPEKINGAIGPPRWVGSGWTIFNNKGKPVREYESFFASTYRFEFGLAIGVSPVLFYDPTERVIATLHPNHTYEKVVYDPWQQTTYDVNDTCASRNAQTGDPRTDPDIHGYVARYFSNLPGVPGAPEWLTWQERRTGPGELGPHEQAAATRAAAHADTPATVHFDTLGRPFMTVARNRVVCAGHDLDGTEESFATRVELDIEGNQRAVHDERKVPVNGLPTGALERRIVMRYAYDMLGNCIHQHSMDAGARWMLNDAAGKPIRAWDSRGHNFTSTYDALRRPAGTYVLGTTGESDPRTRNPPNAAGLLVDKIEYGEPPLNPSQAEEDRAQRLNLRTRIYRQFDSAGLTINARLGANSDPLEAYDFKGNLLCSTRRLATLYKEIPDWSQNAQPQVEAERFEGGTRYDALNRPVQAVAPHSDLKRGSPPKLRLNIIQPVFNEANLLERVDVWLERAAEPATLLDPNAETPSPVGVANIDYNAKGQRTGIDLRTRDETIIRTTYTYDPDTFRLIQLYTRRGVDPSTEQGLSFADDCENPTPSPDTIAAPEVPPTGKHCGLQNLRYTYDPAGNITHIQDDAQQTIFFRNQRVEPSNDYTYDARYRLLQAAGREHLGQQANGDRNPPTAPDAFNAFHTGQDHPNVLKAMGRYVERYVYDAVGNFLRMQHRGTDPAHPGWTRAYDYHEPSLIEDGSGGAPLTTSNRLTQTALNPTGASPQVEPYRHDAHGNMVRMPHLGGGLPGPNMHWDYEDQLRHTDLGGGGTAYYVYDASGQRVRKVWEKEPGLTEERIYLGSLEIFRKYAGPIGANAPTLERETLHVMDDERRIALVETRTLDSAGDDVAPRQLVRYQFGNHLGSASLELDSQSLIISYEEYAPYGSSTYEAVRGQTEMPRRHRYSGKERDEESGVYYHGARYYAPWIGRWTATDPSGLADAANVYEYCRGAPTSRIDPGGTASFLTPERYSGTLLSNIEAGDTGSEPTPPVPPTSAAELREAQLITLAMIGFSNPIGVLLALPSPPGGENASAFQNFSRAAGMAVGEVGLGLGYNTTRGLLGDPVSVRSVEAETEQNAFGIALSLFGTATRGIALYSEMAAAYRPFSEAMASLSTAELAYSNALTGAGGRMVSINELPGLTRMIEEMAWRNWKLSPTQFKYGTNKGIDLFFVGAGENKGLLAVGEAKWSRINPVSLPSTRRGFQQGGSSYIKWSLEQYQKYGQNPGAAKAVIEQLEAGNVRSFFRSRSGFWELRFNESISRFDKTLQAAQAVPLR